MMGGPHRKSSWISIRKLYNSNPFYHWDRESETPSHSRIEVTSEPTFNILIDDSTSILFQTKKKHSG